MKFKVHLLKKAEDRNRDKFSIRRFVDSLRLKFDLYYYGLSPALAGEEIVRVNLTGQTCNTEENFEEYEINAFNSSLGTGFESFFSFAKRKFAYYGLSIMAFLAFMGISSDRASAHVGPEADPGRTEKRVESESPVIQGSDLFVLELESMVTGQAQQSLKLARYHNNTPPYHTNYHSDTGTGHNNVNWTNGHSNTMNWTNASPHTNNDPGDPTDTHANSQTHTDVSSGSIDSDYLY